MIRKTPTWPERGRQRHCYELSQTAGDVALMCGQRQSLSHRRQNQDGKVSDQQEGNSSELFVSVWCQFCIKHKDKYYTVKNGHLPNKCTVRGFVLTLQLNRGNAARVHLTSFIHGILNQKKGVAGMTGVDPSPTMLAGGGGGGREPDWRCLHSRAGTWESSASCTVGTKWTQVQEPGESVLVSALPLSLSLSSLFCIWAGWSRHSLNYFQSLSCKCVKGWRKGRVECFFPASDMCLARGNCPMGLSLPLDLHHICGSGDLFGW